MFTRCWSQLGFCLVVGLFLLPGYLNAQFFDSLVEPETTLVLSNNYPEPGDTVSVSLDDYSGGVFGAQIEWRFAGELLSSVTNQRQVSITAGEVGIPTTIEAVLTLPSGEVRTVSQTITPRYLDIIIEPQTRVPEWYQGRALPSFASIVNATALLSEETIIDNDNLVYTWQIGDQIYSGGPVRGQNKISFVVPRGATFLVGVTIARTDGTVLGNKIQEIRTFSPKLHFYEVHSLYGPKPVPITGQVPLIGNVTLQAEPFYLDTRVYNQPDVAEWEIGRTQTDNGQSNPYQITLAPQQNGGVTEVSFHVRSLQQVLQGVEDSIRLSF